MDFIGEMRDKAKDMDKVSHGRPILPMEKDADPPYIDVNLQQGGLDKGLARIRRYDLRLINYQDPFGNLIDVDEYKLYDDDSRLLNLAIEGLSLGLPTFIEAVNSLVNSCKKLNYFEKNVDEGTSFLVMCNKRERTNSLRTSLAVLCMVLCEATKFNLFSGMLGNAFKYGFEVPLTSWLLYHINDWGHFSKELLAADLHSDDTDCDFYLPDDKNAWNDKRRVIGVTCQDVARCLGILRAFPAPPDLMEEEHLLGTKLIEIYSVSVYFRGGTSGRVYGKIMINNGDSKFCIYDRAQHKSELVESHGKLTLQEPDDFISTKWGIAIELDLKEEGGDNLEIVNGVLHWDPFARDDGGAYDYNSRLSGFVKGKNGYAIVYYTMHAEAIQAVVETTLIIKEGHPNTNEGVCVCGKLSARYGDFVYALDIYEKYYETVLFDKPVNKLSALPCTLETGMCKRGEGVKVGEAIKLSRSRVTVSVDSSLVIVANLKSCEGNPIVTGSMEWHPRELGDFEGIMEGQPEDSYSLQVKVKWIQNQRDIEQ